MNHTQRCAKDVLGATETDCIFVPLTMPTLNKALNWHPMSRAKNVVLIHEAIAVSAEHLFTEDSSLPLEWEWHDTSGPCPLVNATIKRNWFLGRWMKAVLSRKTLDPQGCGTVIEVSERVDGRSHVHCHSIIKKLMDEDGACMKHLVDGLVRIGMFPDDNTNYVAGVTQSQEKFVKIK